MQFQFVFFTLPYVSSEIGGPEYILMGLKMYFFLIPYCSLEMVGTEYIFMGMKLNGLEYLVCLMTDLIMPVS